MNIESPEQWANRVYLANRPEFDAPIFPRHTPSEREQLQIQRNKRIAEHDHNHAEWLWSRRHK